MKDAERNTKMETKFVVLLVACTSLAVSSLPLPKYMKQCARNDPDFSECMRKHAQEVVDNPQFQKGDRKYNLIPLNPVFIPEMKVSQEKGLSITLTDLKIFGVTYGTVVKKANVDFKQKRIQSTMMFPELRAVSKYEMNGRILVLPIQGKGNATFDLENVLVPFTCDYVLQTINGKEYMKMMNAKAQITPSSVKMHFTNLFKGNEQLGEQTNQFLNENSADLIQEFGPIFGLSLSEIGSSILNSIAATVPYDDVFPEKLP